MNRLRSGVDGRTGLILFRLRALRACLRSTPEHTRGEPPREG